ncbi:MAG: Rod shape-determining protein MreD [Bacteroidia bacterium]|nr:Rod shape-determining protein MreD [Bacteroidia bacterium]
MPVETSKLILMGIGFFAGFVIDIFNDSLGLHALACVSIMYLRNYWLNLLTPQGGYDSNARPALSTQGLQWFLVYAVPLVLVHHLILFYVEAGGFSLFWFTLWKAVASTLLTSLIMVLVQFLFPARRRI